MLFIPPFTLSFKHGVKDANYTVNKEVSEGEVNYEIAFDRLPRKVKINDNIIGVVRDVTVLTGFILIKVSPYIEVDCKRIYSEVVIPYAKYVVLEDGSIAVFRRGRRIRSELKGLGVSDDKNPRYVGLELKGLICYKVVNGKKIFRDITDEVKRLTSLL